MVSAAEVALASSLFLVLFILASALSVAVFFNAKRCRKQFPFVIWAIFNTAFTWVTSIAAIFTQFVYMLSVQNLFLFAVLGTTSVLTFQYHAETLQYVDDAWRTWMYPLLRDIAEPLLLLLRLFYDSIIPLYNMGVIVMAQLTLGTASMLTNCELEGLYTPLHHFSNGTIALAHGVSDFLSTPSGDINLKDAYGHYLMALSELDDGIECACGRLASETDVLLYAGKIDAMSTALNDATNVPISAIHEIVHAFDTGVAPTFDKTADRMSAAVVELGIGMDEWAFYALEKLHAINRAKMVHAPKEAAFSTVARAFVGAAISPAHGALRGTLNLLNSPTAPEIVEGYSMDMAWSNMYIAAHDAGQTIHFWSELFEPSSQRNAYNCDWRDDESVATFGKFSDTAACTVENAARAVVGSVHVLYDMVFELVLLEDRPYNFFQILQRYDGEWKTRGRNLECECDCNMGIGSWTNSTTYRGWCDTPTLQTQVFGPLETAVVKLGRGTLGSVSYIATTPVRSLIEVARIGTRTLLSVNQMLEGNWAYLPLGCGYGTSDKTQCMGRMYTSQTKECALGGNFASDCMCNYLDAPSDTDNCQCISKYPAMNADIEAFEAAAPNWCNSMYLEHNWKLLDEVGEATERLLFSLGDEMTEVCAEFEVAKLSTTAHFGDRSLNDAKEDCDVWGNHNFVCSGGSAARAAVSGVVNLARQMTGDIIRLFEGDVHSLELDFAPRICDFEKFLAQTSSVAGNLLMFASPEQRVAFTKIGFAVLDGGLAAPTKIVHAAYFALVDILELSENSGQFQARYVGDSAKTTIVDMSNIVFDVVEVGLDAFAEFFDTMGTRSPKPGQFFRDVKAVVTNLKRIITNDVLDVFTDVADIFVRLLSIITGNSSASAVEKLLDDIMDIVKRFSEAIMVEYMSFLDVVFAFLGDFGTFLKSLSGDVCNVIKTLAKIVGQGDSVQCFEHRGGRRLAGEHITQWVSSNMAWDGNTVCDYVMANTDTEFEALSVLEKAVWTDCLQKRLVGEKIAEYTRIANVKDVLYNYKRKYMIAWDLARHFVATRDVETRIEAYDAFVRHNLNPDMHMAIYDWQVVHWDTVVSAAAAVVAREMPAMEVDIDFDGMWQNFQVLANTVPTFNAVTPQFIEMTNVLMNTFPSGAPIDASTDQCAGETCTRCTAIDNLVSVVVRESQQVSTFYSYAYPKLLRDVENFRFKPVGAFEGGTIFNVQDAINPMRWSHVREDWTSLTNGTEGIGFVLEAVSRFITTTNNSYVPLFGVGAPYVVLGPVFESCDAESMLYYDPAKSAERADLVGTGLMAVAIYFVVVTYLPFGGPLLSTMVLVAGSMLVYLYTVYGYLPSCVPSLPYSLVDDMYAWADSKRALQHFCEYVPDLYDGACGTQNNTLAKPYIQCETLIDTFRPVSDGDWGTWWWPALTWVRHTFGSAPWISWLQRYTSGALFVEMEKWRLGEEVVGVELQCMTVMYPVIPFTFLAMYMFLALPVRIATVIVKSIIDSIVTVNAMYEFLRSVAMSVVQKHDDSEKSTPPPPANVDSLFKRPMVF